MAWTLCAFAEAGIMRRAARLLAGWALAVLMVCQVGPPARSQRDDRQLAGLIEQLGDDDSDVRKAAEKKLTEVGEPALDLLRKAAKDSRDADVKLHAMALVKAIEKNAFASIRQYTGHTGHIRHIAL